MREQIKLNERASLNRPAWSSESSTGLWDAYRHQHVSTKDRPMVKNYFDKTRGVGEMRLKKERIYSGDELKELGYELIEEQCIIVDQQTRLFYIVLDEGNDNYSLIRGIKK